MLDVADDAADVGRCEAEAICASDRAVSVKPAIYLSQRLVYADS